jgi:hypothetical protein
MNEEDPDAQGGKEGGKGGKGIGGWKKMHLLEICDLLRNREARQEDTFLGGLPVL